MYSNLFVNFTD